MTQGQGGRRLRSDAESLAADGGGRRSALRSKYGFRLISLVVAAMLPIALGASTFVWYVARQERAAVDRLRVEVAARAASLVDRELDADIGVLRALAVSTRAGQGGHRGLP